MIFITLETRDKTRIENNWFPLVQWVAKNSKTYKKWCSVKKEFFKILQSLQKIICAGVSF